MTLAHDTLRAAVATSSPARSLIDLADRPWVMEPEGTAAREWSVQLCRAAGFEPEVRFETADLMAHVRLIRAGHAAGVLPDLVWAGDESPLHLLDLDGAPQREVFSSARASAAARPGVVAVRNALSRAASGRE